MRDAPVALPRIPPLEEGLLLPHNGSAYGLELALIGRGGPAAQPIVSTGPMPGVLNPPDPSILLPSASPPQRSWLGRLWDGVSNFFGVPTSAPAPAEGGQLLFEGSFGGSDDAIADPAGAPRSIAIGSPAEPVMSLSDPNPFTRVRSKLEIEMPGNESLDSFLGWIGSLAPSAHQAEARSILSLLSDRSAGSGPLAAQLRQEVAAEVHGSSASYLNRHQLADAVRTVLARHGLDATAIGTSLNPAERSSLEAVMQDLSLQLIPDDVPVYRTSGRGVREGATTTVMKANMDGMTYWGVGSDGIATAEAYLSEGRALVTTTVGELRRLGVMTTDDIAKAGNAVELYHEPRAVDGSWVHIPVRIVNRSGNP